MCRRMLAMQGSERQALRPADCCRSGIGSDNVASPHVFQRAPRAPPTPRAAARCAGLAGVVAAWRSPPAPAGRAARRAVRGRAGLQWPDLGEPGRGLLEPGRAGAGARLPVDGRPASARLVDHGRRNRRRSIRRPGRRAAPMTLPTATGARPRPGRRRSGPGAFFALSTDFGGDRFTLALRDVHALPAADPLPAVADRRRADPLPRADARPAQPGAGAGAVDPVRQRLPDRRSRPGSCSRPAASCFAEDLGSTAAAPARGERPLRRREPAAAARYDISSGNGLGDAKFSVTLGAGIYYRRKSFELGVAYQSRPLGSDVPRRRGRRPAHAPSRCRRAIRWAAAAPLTCPNGQSSRCVFGDISYRLPDVWIAGATWRLGPGWSCPRWCAGSGCTCTTGSTSACRARRWTDGTSSPSTSCSTADSRTSGTRGCASRTGGASGSGSARCCGSRPARSTRARSTPAAVDGFKVEPVGLIEFRMLRQLWLGGGYGVTFMPRRGRHRLRVQARARHRLRQFAATTSRPSRLPGAAGRPARVRPPPGTTRRRRRISASR